MLSSICLSFSLSGQGKVTTPILEVIPDTDPGVLATFKALDKGADNSLTIENGTGTASFIPVIRGINEDNRSGLILLGQSEDDSFSDPALIVFDARKSTGPAFNRKLFAWSSYGNTIATLDKNGKFEFTEGSIFIEDSPAYSPLVIKNNLTDNWTEVHNNTGLVGYYGIYNDDFSMDFGTDVGNINGSTHLVTDATPRLTVAPAGEVGIGTQTPNSSSILELSSTSKGLLVPRMDSIQMTAIVSPSEGLMLYNTDASALFMFTNGTWTRTISTSMNGNLDEQITLSSPEGNVLLGENAGNAIDGGLGDNTFIGKNAGFSNGFGGRNTFIGSGAGYFNSTGTLNTYVGRTSGRLGNGSRNAFLGQDCGFFMATGSYNTFLGYGAGISHTGGDGNVLIGNEAGANASGSNKLYIENTNDAEPLIYGEFDNDLVKINGSMHVKDFMELTPGSAPASPTKGTIYYDSSDDKVKVWTGASWSNLN